VSMSRLYAPVHAACPCPAACLVCVTGMWTCSRDVDMQHGHGNAAWTWACNMERCVQHGHGHEAWTGTCSVDMDLQHGRGMDKQHVLTHVDVPIQAACTCPRCMSIYAACSFSCCMSKSMLHVHIRTAWSRTCSIGIHIQHRYGHGHAA
jgi:hypothetical protein